MWIGPPDERIQYNSYCSIYNAGYADRSRPCRIEKTRAAEKIVAIIMVGTTRALTITRGTARMKAIMKAITAPTTNIC